MKKTTWPGNWKTVCDVCDFWFPSSDLRKRWDGLMVCQKDWETRHPQDLIKIRGEKAVPSFVRKDPPDQFINTCTIEGSSGYVGLGTAGCMQVENTTFSYAFLTDLLTNGH